VVTYRQCDHVVHEKEIMMSLNSPFVVKMYHSFKVSSWASTYILYHGYHNVRRIFVKTLSMTLQTVLLPKSSFR